MECGRAGLSLAGSEAMSETLASTVLPVSFRLLPDSPRPQIELRRIDGTRKSLI
jgi:hypothetical protein